jgi:hypothetical protein
LYKETKRLFLPRDSPSRVYPKLCQSMTNDEFLNQLAHFTATRVGTEGGFCTNKGMREVKYKTTELYLLPPPVVLLHSKMNHFTVDSKIFMQWCLSYSDFPSRWQKSCRGDSKCNMDWWQVSFWLRRLPALGVAAIRLYLAKVRVSHSKHVLCISLTFWQ